MAVNNDGHLLDSKGNVVVDFVWGNMPMQPNDIRTVKLDTALSNHKNATSGWNGFPLYLPNDPGVGATFILVPNVIGETIAFATDALQDSTLVVTVASAVTPAISSVALTTNVATLLTSAAHGYAVGDSVVIAGLVDVVADIYSDLNGTYTLIAGTTGSTLKFNKTHADLAANTTTALSSPTAKVLAKAGLIKTQSIAAGAASVASGAAVTITPYFAS